MVIKAQTVKNPELEKKKKPELKKKPKLDNQFENRTGGLTGPSPVTRDDEGQLSTGFSPLKMPKQQKQGVTDKKQLDTKKTGKQITGGHTTQKQFKPQTVTAPTTPTTQEADEMTAQEKSKLIDKERERIRNLENVSGEDRDQMMQDLNQKIKSGALFRGEQDDFVTDVSELSEAERRVYNMLSDTEKEQFKSIGEAARKAGQDYVKAQAEYLADAMQAKSRLEEDQATQEQMNELSEEIRNIQGSQTIRKAKRQLDNIKQNIHYLGTRGMPGVSATKIGAMERQISDAERTYKEIVTTETKLAQARALGYESQAKKFERALEDLQNDLDSKVNDVIQNHFDDLNRAEILAELDSVEDVENLRVELLNDLDKQITGITDANIKQRQFLIDEYKDIADRQQEYIQNRNTVNPSMSSVQGYYVDGNGDPIVSSTTGQRIPYPEEAPIPPSYDPKTGRLVTFSYDENGQIVGTQDQVFDDPTFAEKTVSGYVNLITKGRMSLDDIRDIDPALLQNEQILNAFAEAPSEAIDASDRYKISGGKVFDTQTGQFVSEDEAMGDMSGVDLSQNQDLINKYPLEASFKNNNPTGITFGAMSEQLKQAFDEAGIEYTEGTPRPKKEGGNYVKFASVQDGLDAYAISLTQAGSDDIYSRLQSWKGVGDTEEYANSIMQQAGIPKGTKFSELSETELTSLMDKHLKRESPAFHREVIQGEQLTAQDEGPVGSLGVPISFERQIKQMVPTQLMNSEVELEALNDTIQRLHKAGYSTDEAVLTYMGFNVQDEEQKQQAMKFVDIARTLGTEIPESYIPKVANFINSGEPKKAMNLTERVVKKTMSSELGDEFIPENVAKTSIQRVNQLQDIINKLETSGENPIGEFEGTLEGWLGRFKSEESQKIATQAERLIAKMRTELIGTAGTQTENTNIDNLIPRLSDDTRNFEIKINNMGDETLRELNNQRSEYGLPELDSGALKSKEERLRLYKPPLTPEQARARLQEITGSEQPLGSQAGAITSGVGTRTQSQDTGSLEIPEGLDEEDMQFFQGSSQEDIEQTDIDFYNSLQ